MDGVRPDGKLQGHDAWYLTTALAAVAEDEQPNLPRATGLSPPAHFADRLPYWQEIYANDREPNAVDFTTMAELLGEDPETLLTWLHAGLPYISAGNWHTGGGFTFRPAWVIDWALALGCLARFSSDREAARKLRLNR